MTRITAVLATVLFLTVGCGGEADPSSGGGQAHTSAPTTPSSGATTTSTGAERGALVRIPTSDGEEVVVSVEIADEEAERAEGLMYRRSLPDNAGMLFVYNRERPLSFWMRNTYIPLSIAFADSEGRIVDIQDMEPLDDEPPSYVSDEPARYALEVNQGFFDERGVEVGDRMDLPPEVR